MAAPDGWVVGYDSNTMKRWVHPARGDQVSTWRRGNWWTVYVFPEGEEQFSPGKNPSKASASQEAHKQMRRLNKLAEMNN